MAQTRTGFAAALIDVWGSKVIEEQLYTGSPLLSAIEKQEPIAEIGKKALIAVHTGRNGGYSAASLAGSSSLNKAKAQETKQAEYTYARHFQSVEIDNAVIDDSANSAKAVANAAEFEMKNAIENMRKQMTRQLFSNGDGQIAATTTTSSGQVVKLSTSGYGYDALRRGWLFVGLPVDIGTASEPTSVASAREITAVNISSTEPTITIGGAAVEVGTTQFVSVAGNRSGSTTYEMSGLRNLIAASGTVGGLATSEIPSWASTVNSTAQTLTPDLVQENVDAVFQATGDEPDWAITSTKQYGIYYNQLQNQVRFAGDGGLGYGDKSKLLIGASTQLERHPDCPDKLMFLLTKKDLCRIQGKEGPKWLAESNAGSNGPLQWVPGTTFLTGTVEHKMQLGVKRRNSHAAITNLS